MKEEEYLQRKVTRRAMHLLEKMDRTEKNLRDKLRQSDYPTEMIDHAVEYVKSYGYIDDMRYAQNYIRYRIHAKSRIQLWQSLYGKGISRDIFDQAWEELAREEQPDEQKIIRDLIYKRCGDRKELDEKEYRRLQGYLARRGFSWEDVAHVMSEEQIHCRITGKSNN